MWLFYYDVSKSRIHAFCLTSIQTLMKIKQNLKWKILHKTTRNKRSDGCILPTNFHKKVPSKLEIKFKSMHFSFDFDWYCINFNIVSYKQGMRGGKGGGGVKRKQSNHFTFMLYVHRVYITRHSQ